MTVCRRNMNTHHSRDYEEHEDKHVLGRLKSHVIMWPISQIYCKALKGMGGRCDVHPRPLCTQCLVIDSSWSVTAHGDAWEGKWRGNRRMELVASTLHTPSEHGVSSITTADEHTSAASFRLNWRPSRFKRTCPFRRKMKSGFCTCAITFQLASTAV